MLKAGLWGIRGRVSVFGDGQRLARLARLQAFPAG
jgi:hypothetical protein